MSNGERGEVKRPGRSRAWTDRGAAPECRIKGNRGSPRVDMKRPVEEGGSEEAHMKKSQMG